MNELDEELIYKVNYREEFKRYYRLYYHNSTLDITFNRVNRETKNIVNYSSSLFIINLIFYRLEDLLKDLYFNFNRVLE